MKLCNIFNLYKSQLNNTSQLNFQSHDQGLTQTASTTVWTSSPSQLAYSRPLWVFWGCCPAD